MEKNVVIKNNVCVRIDIYMHIHTLLYINVCIMAPHSSTLAWRIPRAEEHGRLQSMGSLRIGHD